MDRRAAIYRYCNYQERSQQEVRDKLYELGAATDEVNQLIAELIEAGLLNEERFARSFARGKFKLKQWGRIKIIHELKAHRISAYLIKKALSEIDPGEYFSTALKYGRRKWEGLKEADSAAKRSKVFRYLQQKGYEPNIISEIIKNIAAPE
jgi:regulatory protein